MQTLLAKQFRFLPTFLSVIILMLCIIFSYQSPIDNFNKYIEDLRQNRSLMGVAIQLTNESKIIYNYNSGLRDNKNPIVNQTMFRMASLSKSFSSVALMQLVEANKIKLTQSLSQLLGFSVINPFFPTIPITLQMILSHQSSFIECEPYYSNFLTDTYNAEDGFKVPNISQILTPSGKYYNKCLFSSVHKPGQNFLYVNLNFGIAGTIVQKVSGVRFDQYQRDNILKYISEGLSENATFNPSTITNSSRLGAIFVGSKGEWVPSIDYYPDGKIPTRNLTGYIIGKNGVIYGPQGGLRASVSHLSNYILMIKNKGLTVKNKRILTEKSIKQIIKPRYQYHGSGSGSVNDLHNYGLGLFRTSYRVNDQVITHEVANGHLGSAYGLVSGYFYWKNYTLTYMINGALNGYQYGTGTIYQDERLSIHHGAQKFIEETIMSKKHKIRQVQDNELSYLQ